MHSTVITVADSHFHQKIINRYQKGKTNVFKSPLLIFLKNKRHILSLKINIDILVKVFNKISKKFIKNSPFSLIKIKDPIQQFIFQEYPLESCLTDSITFFQYHKTERMQNSGHVWPAYMPKVQLKVNNRTEYINLFYPEVIYTVLLQGPDQPISLYPKPEQRPQNMQRFPYNTGQYFTKTNTIQDTRNVSFSNIRNIYSMVNNSKFATSIYPEAVYRVLLRGINQPISQYPKPEQRSQNMQRFPYNTGQYFTKTNTIQETRNVPASIIRNIHLMVNNRTQFAPLFYPEVVYRVLQQGAEQTFENHQYSKPTGIPSFSDRSSIVMNGGFLYFDDQQTIEREIEEVKKIAMDTREAVRERTQSSHTSYNTDLTKHLDVHWLSDRVYQNIEQRIRIEKERRGL